MASFLEVKKFICHKLRVSIQTEEDIDENNDIELSVYAIGGRFTVTLINNELKELLDKVQQGERVNTDFLYGNSFEAALNFKNERILSFRAELSFLNIEDEQNHVCFSVSEPSIEYCLFLISHLCDNSSDELRRRLRTLPYHRSPLQYERGRDEDQAPEPTHDWKEAVIGCFRRLFYTLKINSTERRNMDYYVEKKNAYFFTCMYNLDPDYCPVEYHNLNEIIPQREFRRHPNTTELSSPSRKYNNELVEFFKTAISASDPFIQYISFYHVLEYYFDEIFKNHLVGIIRDKITLPDFSHKNDTKLYDLAKAIRKELKTTTDETQGNELETLKYVLQQYVKDIERLKNRIEQLSNEERILQYYQTSKVPFVNGTKAKTIAWTDSVQVHKNIAERIYQTRNALVHSKKENGGGIYNPAKNENDLIKELPLVRAIAEEIIINSSKID